MDKKLQLVFEKNGELNTNSLILGEEFEKEHDDVLRDLRKQISKLIEAGEEEFSLLNFAESDYINERGRKYKKIDMTEDGFVLVAMSYNTPKAMKGKVRIIQEFNRMKQELQNRNTKLLPSNYKEALLALVEQVEQNERLHTEKLMLEQVVAENKPKITYYDTILRTKKTINIKQIAVDYGLTAQKLNKILYQRKVQYKQSKQWLLYKDHLGKGYTQSESFVYKDPEDNEITKLITKWTQKGRLFIHGILEEMDIKPLMDEENGEAV